MPAPCREPVERRDGVESLAGLRVLVVEDEALLALDLEEGLVAEGCEVVGPAGNLSQALKLARDRAVDAAILDINLAGEAVFPLAEMLAERQVPLFFATAYPWADEIYPPKLRSAPRLSKPYTVAQAVGQLRRLVSA